MQGTKLHLLQAFLYFTNSLWGEYVNEFWLSHKGRLLICGSNFRPYRLEHYFHSYIYKILAQSTKSRKVDAIMSILRKIQNHIKFETFLRFRPNFWKKTTHVLSTIMKNSLAQNLNLAELRAKMLFFWKNQNFIKSERSNGFFPNSISIA